MRLITLDDGLGLSALLEPVKVGWTPVEVGDDTFYVPVYDYPLSCTGVPAGRIRARAEQLLAEGVDRGQAWMEAVMEEVE